jgi:uncharacterized membrane protein
MEYWSQVIAQCIGYIGVAVVIIGVIDMTIRFIFSFTKFNDNSARLRYSLMRYLELSLDFFIAKDIINLSMDNTDYSAIIRIAITIGIRIVLSYFILFQERSIHKSGKLS